MSILTNAVSDYGATKDKKYFTYAGISMLLSNILLAIAFLFLPDDFKYKYLAFITLFIRAMTIIGVIWYPTKIGNTFTDKSSKLHLIFAVMQFTALAIFIFNIGQPLQDYKPSGYYSMLSILEILVKIGLYGLCIGLILKPVKKLFGIFERVFLFSSALFLMIVAFILSI